MNLTPLPKYDEDSSPEQQLSAMRTYLNSMKRELDSSLSNIGMDNLDAELRDKFDSLSDNLYVLERANTSVATLGNKLQKVLNDYVTSAMLGEAMDELAGDIADDVSVIVGQLQNAIDAVARDVSTLQGQYSNLYDSVQRIAQDVTDLKNYAVTTNNADTKLADKTLKVDKLVAVTSVTSPNYYN